MDGIRRSRPRRAALGLLGLLAVAGSLSACGEESPATESAGPGASGAPVPQPPFELTCPGSSVHTDIDYFSDAGEETPEATVDYFLEDHPELSVTSAPRTPWVTDLALYDKEGTIIFLAGVERQSNDTWVMSTTEACDGVKPWG